MKSYVMHDRLTPQNVRLALDYVPTVGDVIESTAGEYGTPARWRVVRVEPLNVPGSYDVFCTDAEVAKPLPSFLWSDGDLYIRVTETRYAAPADLRKPAYWVTCSKLDPSIELPEAVLPVTNDADYELWREWWYLPGKAGYFADWLKERKARS